MLATENTNFLFLENGFEKDYYLDVNKELKKSILIVAKEDVEINLNFLLDESSKVDLYCLVIATNKANVKVNIKSSTEKNLTNFTAKLIALGLKESKSHLTISSKVDRLTKHNKVDQTIKGIIISEKSKISGEPVLIINTEDIYAKHALNIGTLNLEELFYLQTKGISTSKAKQMILNGLVEKVFESLDENTKSSYFEHISNLMESN